MRLPKLIFSLTVALGLATVPVSVSSDGVAANELCARGTCMNKPSYHCAIAKWPYGSNQCELGTPGCIPSQT